MPTWLDVSITSLTLVFMLVGLFGLVVPLFPGIVVIWLAGLGYGVVSGFSTLGWVVFGFLTGLMLFGTVVDNLMMGAGARREGASWPTIGLALVAGVAGTLLWPPLGGILAAPLTVLLLEYLRTHDLRKAAQALRGLATGWGLSVLVRFGVGVVMIALWGLWAWKG